MRMRALQRGLVLVAAIAGVAAADAADTGIDVHAARGGLAIEASASLHADRQTAWNVLAGYERYARFVPGVRESRVLWRRSDEVSVRQSWDLLPGVPMSPLAVTWRIVESQPVSLASVASIDGMGTLEGRYRLVDAGGTTTLVYTGRLEMRDGVLRPLEEALARRAIARQWQALADEIERAAPSGDRGGAAAGPAR